MRSSKETDIDIIYSEILPGNVRKCCYQSARLNDKFSVCGRTLDYPPQAQSKPFLIIH